MKKFISAIGLVTSFVLSGCVDVKIASEIPAVEYFNIQSYEDSKDNRKCSKMPHIGLLDVNVASAFSGTDIVVLDHLNLQTTTLEGKKWVSAPKEMLKYKFLTLLQNQCYKASLQPFGTQKLDKILKITLTSFAIIKKQEGYFAQVSVFYEIQSTHNYSVLKSASITRQKSIRLNDSSFALAFRDLSDEVLGKVIQSI